MCCVAAQENTPVAKAFGNHTASSPVFLCENFERESGVDAEDLPDATVTVEGRQIVGGRTPIMDEPPLSAVNREQIAAASRIERNV